MDLFEEKDQLDNIKDRPLSVRMRPGNLEEFTGQEHILGEGKLLKRIIKADRISSLILYGPPGTGKTALAHIIANITKAVFEQVNAVDSNVGTLRKLIAAAKQRRISGRKTILFIDEIHRFNKAQQDVLMPDVEEGTIILIGATTHNPFFSINSPLLSRSHIFELELLSEDDLIQILKRALEDKDKGLGNLKIKMDHKALAHLAKVSDGDARKALNSLEVGALTTAKDSKGIINFTLSAAEESIQKKAVIYDRDEDAHYDTASAFIKSMRGSDPDAALYWMAKMLYAGEDPRFIARRIVICAAEDVGNADPHALMVANAALQISEFVGLPECRIPLAQAVTYIATAPKSNAAYMGIEKAAEDVKQGRTLEVPQYLKEAGYPGADKLGRGQGYKYAHDFPGHFVEQDYIPVDKVYYQPSESGYEAKIKQRLTRLRQRRRKIKPKQNKST